VLGSFLPVMCSNSLFKMIDGELVFPARFVFYKDEPGILELAGNASLVSKKVIDKFMSVGSQGREPLVCSLRVLG
jgi:hypothetical protein